MKKNNRELAGLAQRTSRYISQAFAAFAEEQVDFRGAQEIVAETLVRSIQEAYQMGRLDALSEQLKKSLR